MLMRRAANNSTFIKSRKSSKSCCDNTLRSPVNLKAKIAQAPTFD